MHLITQKICVPSKSDLYPQMLNPRVHVPLNQNVSGNAAFFRQKLMMMSSDLTKR